MIICPSSYSSLLQSFVCNLGPPDFQLSIYNIILSVALKVFFTILPIPQRHPNHRTVQVSSLEVKQNNKSEYMSCAAKKNPSVISFPHLRNCLPPHQPTVVALHTCSMENKGIKENKQTRHSIGLLKFLQRFPTEFQTPCLSIRGIF